MKSDAHSEFVKEVFKEAGIVTTKLLHAFRPSGAILASQMG
jgi:hypothetical protein